MYTASAMALNDYFNATITRSVISCPSASTSVSYNPIVYQGGIGIAYLGMLLLCNASSAIKGRFCNNSEIDTLISKRSSVENKAKLSQLTRADFVTIARLTH